ncbi:MAG: hypothetical protein M1825_005460 [Sarcosagium campestre]|nr:MAG: hypothetical protein M1825_005460 [Sarcosagium campestre]
MSRPETPPLLAELQEPSSPEAQLAALKALKNELIGHEQRKEMWLGYGVSTPIVRILASSRSEGKRRSTDSHPHHAADSRALTVEAEARLQATIIIGSLARGGPSLVTPLLEASAVPPLLDALNTAETPPTLVLETLRTLNTMADALALKGHFPPSNDDGENLDRLFGDSTAFFLSRILLQSSASPIVQQQINLTASLVAKTCKQERHLVALADAGVLDALSTLLARFIVSMGFVLPNAETVAQRDGTIESFPKPAPKMIKLHLILEAVSVLIQNSKARSMQLLLSPAIRIVFPAPSADNALEESRNPWTANGRDASPARRWHLNPIDHLLPQVPIPPSSKTAPAPGSFPAPGSVPRPSGAPPTTWSTNDPQADGNFAACGAQELGDGPETPLVAWLIHVTRAHSGLTRLMAASVLTLLHRAGLTSKRREVGLALLVVPLIVRMFDEDVPASGRLPLPTGYPGVDADDAIMIQEKAPAVFAMLVKDSEVLQKAGVAAQAIKKLSQTLKKAYDPNLEPVQTPLWNPSPAPTQPGDATATAAEHAGASYSPARLHKWRVREGTLKALAALAPFSDEFRRMIIDNGVTPFIVESLKTNTNVVSSTRQASSTEQAPPASSSPQPDNTPAADNPYYVPIAACSAIRALSRSVGILRTSLIDAGVAMPLFALLKHPDLDVKIAATSAVCNLVLEFSPMRDAIMEAGVLKILCEHAHSTNGRLRLEAVWALKHLVFSAENEVKMACVEELGLGWLIRLICDDAEYATHRLHNDAGDAVMADSGGSFVERGGVLISYYYPKITSDAERDDVRMGDNVVMPASGTSDYGSRFNWDPQTPHVPVDVPGPEPTGDRLTALRRAEPDGSTKAHVEDMAIQEQALDFIRNLTCGTGTIEMIDYVFSRIGQERLFGILASKLRPKVVVVNGEDNDDDDNNNNNNNYDGDGGDGGGSSSRSGINNSGGAGAGTGPSSGETRRMTEPQAEIIVAVCFILVHIAAGHPRHRQMLIAQTELLKLLVPLFQHPNKNVRRALAWVIINLTWVDDQADHFHCKGRARELKKLGFQAKLQALEHDPELDVRERTKTALFQIKHALSET